MSNQTFNKTHFEPTSLKLEYGATPDEATHYWGIAGVEELRVVKKAVSAVNFLMIDNQILAVVEVLQHDLKRGGVWGEYVICNVAFNTSHPAITAQSVCGAPENDPHVKNPLYATTLNASALICHAIHNEVVSYKLACEPNGVCVNFLNTALAIGDCADNMKSLLKATSVGVGEYTGYEKLPVVGVDYQNYMTPYSPERPKTRVVHKRVAQHPGLNGANRAPSLFASARTVENIALKLRR